MEFQENTVTSGIEDLDAIKSETFEEPAVAFVKTEIDDLIQTKSDSDTEEKEAPSTTTSVEGYEIWPADSKPTEDSNGHIKGDIQELMPSCPEDDASTDLCKRTSWPAMWLEEHEVDERVIALIYWSEWQKTAPLFVGMLILLLSLGYYPFLCVVTTFMKAVLGVSFLYRIGMTIVNAVQKTSAEHPLRHLLDEKIEISEEMMKEWPELARVKINAFIKQAQHLFLINDFIDSLKFGVLLWLVSYFASWFSLLTLVTMPVVAVFTLPKFYEHYQIQVNHGIDVGKAKVIEVYNAVDSKVPTKFKFYSTKKTQ